jgi:hypothetical protein
MWGKYFANSANFVGGICSIGTFRKIIELCSRVDDSALSYLCDSVSVRDEDGSISIFISKINLLLRLV